MGEDTSTRIQEFLKYLKKNKKQKLFNSKKDLPLLTAAPK